MFCSLHKVWGWGGVELRQSLNPFDQACHDKTYHLYDRTGLCEEIITQNKSFPSILSWISMQSFVKAHLHKSVQFVKKCLSRFQIAMSFTCVNS